MSTIELVRCFVIASAKSYGYAQATRLLCRCSLEGKHDELETEVRPSGRGGGLLSLRTEVKDDEEGGIG